MRQKKPTIYLRENVGEAAHITDEKKSESTLKHHTTYQSTNIYRKHQVKNNHNLI